MAYFTTTQPFVGRLLVAVGLVCALARCDIGSTGFRDDITPGAVPLASTTAGTSVTTGATTGLGVEPVPAVTPLQNGDAALAVGIQLAPGGAAAAAYGLADSYWSATTVSLSQLVSGASPAAVLVVGRNDNGNCLLAMPAFSGVPDDNIGFDPTQDFETLLAALDAANARVVVQVQPGKAALKTLASTVMQHFQGHPSVVGFGIDVQHNNVNAASTKATLSNNTAAAVVSVVQKINPAYLVYLRAASAKVLPASGLTGLVFTGSATGFDDAADMASNIKTWADTFAPAPVQYNLGATVDSNWWCTGTTAPAMAQGLIAAAINAGASNLTGVYWQAESIVSVYPNPTCAAPTPTAGGPTTAGTGTGTAGTGAGTAGTSAGTTATAPQTTGTTTPAEPQPTGGTTVGLTAGNNTAATPPADNTAGTTNTTAGSASP